MFPSCVIPGQCFFSRHPRALYFFTVIPGHFIFLPSSPGFLFYCHPRPLFFIMSSPGLTRGSKSIIWLLFYLDSRVKPENDINFKAQSPSQSPPEHRGLLSTMLSIRRAPAVQVIPGPFIFFLVIPGLDPGIQVKHKANLLTWIAGSSPAMTRKKMPGIHPSKHNLDRGKQ